MIEVIFFKYYSYFFWLQEIYSFPVDTGRKLNVYNTFRRRPGCLTYVQFTSCVYGVVKHRVKFHKNTKLSKIWNHFLVVWLTNIKVGLSSCRKFYSKLHDKQKKVITPVWDAITWIRNFDQLLNNLQLPSSFL